MSYVVTIIAVSVDAYFAALAYGFGEKIGVGKVAYAASFTFFVCVVCCVASERITSAFPVLGKAGGAILFCLGARNYLSRFPDGSLMFERTRGGIAALGLAVSADAGASCLATGETGVFFAITYSLGACMAHFAFLYLGFRCAGIRRTAENATVVSGIALMLTGIFKTVF